jgi:molybdopterin-binding protein
LRRSPRPCGGPISPGIRTVRALWPRPHGRRAAWSRDSVNKETKHEAQRPQSEVDVHKGATTAHVRIDIGNGVVITSSITNEAVDDLGIMAGNEAIAVIKASDEMVAK